MFIIQINHFCKMFQLVTLFVITASVLSFPSSDYVIAKYNNNGLRYQYTRAGDGSVRLADLWYKAGDALKAARYSPDTDNVYHLFTRDNPSVSQPMVYGDSSLVLSSNFDSSRRTILTIHGWLNSASSEVNTVLVPAFLAAEDVNVIVVDWSAGASDENYTVAMTNAISSGPSVATFLSWLNYITGADVSQYHIVGHSLGGQQAGLVGRNLGGEVSYVTGLDPAGPGFEDNENRFDSNDGLYTEVIHTNAGVLGYAQPLAQVDIYPNGGINMPGCASITCDHGRSFFYFAESITTGGFTAVACSTYEEAMAGTCTLTDTLNMGGIDPKTGSTGIYYLTTNAAPPFSTS